VEDFPETPKEDLVESDIEEEQPTSSDVIGHMADQLTKDAPVEEVVEEVKEPEVETPYEEATVESIDEEIPEIQVDEPTKDWEPELYQRKILGRFDAEMGNKPSKTQSFLNKVQNVFASKTIEKEVEELQETKSK
jgi:hypothetical protein